MKLKKASNVPAYKTIKGILINAGDRVNIGPNELKMVRTGVVIEDPAGLLPLVVLNAELVENNVTIGGGTHVPAAGKEIIIPLVNHGTFNYSVEPDAEICQLLAFAAHASVNNEVKKKVKKKKAAKKRRKKAAKKEKTTD